MLNPAPTVDQDQAERFLTALDPNATAFTFQTFDDNADRKDKALVKVLHGTLAQHWKALVRLNARGAGIYVTVNATDLKGRTASNIISVRAVFVDLDGAPLEPVLAEGIPHPHIVTETSSGRWHAYWRVENMPLEEFSGLQKLLIARFNGDKSVHDLPRVMRIPGFIHCKTRDGVTSAPFLSRLVEANDAPCHAWGELKTIMAPPQAETQTQAQPQEQKSTSQPAPHYDETLSMRTRRKLLNTLALQNLAAWVPKFFPKARPTHDGGYRVSSADLSRKLEEDVSFHPSGIKDFGVHDTGDQNEGARTAVNVLIEHGKARDFSAAVRLLTTALGLDPEYYLTQEKLPTSHWYGEEPEKSPAALIQGLVPETGVSPIVGQSGSGKTFLANTMAAHLLPDTEKSVFIDRYRINRKGGVLFFVLEGKAGFPMRMNAAVEQLSGKQLEFGDRGRMPLAWNFYSPNLFSKGPDALIKIAEREAARMRADFRADLVAIFIDTIGLAALYVNEDKSAQIIKVHSGLMKLSDATGGVVIPIDHMGKDQALGGRGSSAKRDVVENLLACLCDTDANGLHSNRRVVLQKIRDGEEGRIIPYRLEVVPRGMDEYGNPASTCVIQWEPNRKPPLKVQQRASPKSVGVMQQAIDKAGGLPADVDKVRQAFNKLRSGSKQARSNSWKQALEVMRLEVVDGMLRDIL
jgi:hypothetical protein